MDFEIQEHSKLVACADQVGCEVSGEAVVLNLKNGRYYGLDEVGSRVWSLVQTPTDAATIRETLWAEFDVERRRCGEDVLLLLNRLAAEGLVIPAAEVRP